MTDKVREAFEKFMVEKHSKDSILMCGTEVDGMIYWDYSSSETRAAWEGYKTATAQSEQELEALRRKLAEQQAIISTHFPEASEAAQKAAGEAQLTRLIIEAEQRGTVNALRDAVGVFYAKYGAYSSGAYCISALKDLADELEGRKV